MLLTVAGGAFAYRLIVIPTADVLPNGIYKMEISAPFNHNKLDEWLPGFKFDGNIAQNFDIAVKGGCPPGEWRASNTLVNVNWQVTKEKDGMPAFGMGVWNLYDSNDHADVKASYFIGLSKSFNVGLKFPIKAFLNYGTEQLDGFSGGVLIPITKQCQAAVEYIPEPAPGNKPLRTPGSDNGLAWAVGYNFTPNWRLKYANLDGDNAWGVVYTSHWMTK